MMAGTHLVTEVEEADCETAEYNGKVHPVRVLLRQLGC